MVQDQGLLLPLSRRGREGARLSAFPAPLSPVPPLALRGLRVRFGAVEAVAGVDLRVDAGAVVGLVGPNGSGKTTVLRAVLGLLEPSAGTISVLGLPGGSLAARAQVAHVPDEPAGLDELTVWELVELTAALWGAGEECGRRALVLLDGFGLGARRRAPLGSLSHGQRRLAATAAAVALSRPVLVVDEATAALDPEAVIVLREVLLGAARRGGAVLLATQDLAFAEAVCTRVALLDRGRVAAEGTPESLRSRFDGSSLEEAFVAAVGASARIEGVRRALEAL